MKNSLITILTILAFFSPHKQKTFPIQLIQDDQDVTDKYLDCNGNICTLQFVRFLYKDSFQIIRTSEPLDKIKRIRLYQAFFASEDNNQGSFTLDIPDKELKVEFEQSSFISKTIKIKAFSFKAVLSVFNYVSASFNCVQEMKFIDTEIRNYKSDCILNMGKDIIKKVYLAHDQWICEKLGDKKNDIPDDDSFYRIYNKSINFDTLPNIKDQVFNFKIMFRVFCIFFLQLSALTDASKYSGTLSRFQTFFLQKTVQG